MFNVGDTILCDNMVGVVTFDNNKTCSIENNFGNKLSVKSSQCQLIMSIKDTLRIYEETLCRLVK